MEQAPLRLKPFQHARYSCAYRSFFVGSGLKPYDLLRINTPRKVSRIDYQAGRIDNFLRIKLGMICQNNHGVTCREKIRVQWLAGHRSAIERNLGNMGVMVEHFPSLPKEEFHHI